MTIGRTKVYEQTARIIAAAVAEAREDIAQGETAEEAKARLEVLRELAGDFSVSYQRDNPRFSNELFLTACGFPVVARK